MEDLISIKFISEIPLGNHMGAVTNGLLVLVTSMSCCKLVAHVLDVSASSLA